MLLAGTSYGLVTPLIKMAIAHGIPVSKLTVSQYPVSIILLWLGALATKKRVSLAKAGKKEVTYMALLGVIGAAASLSYYHSLAFVPGAVGIVLLFQFAWILPVINGLIRRQWPKKHEQIAIAIIVVGTVFAAGPAQWHFPLWAVGLGLLAATLYALSLLLSGHIVGQLSAWQRASISTSVSFVVVLLAEQPWHAPQDLFSLNIWAWGTLVGLFSLTIPLIAIYVSAPGLPAALTGILAAWELPVAVILSSLWLQESVDLSRWLGILLILGGIAFSSVMPVLIENPARRYRTHQIYPQTKSE
ncbi:EamA family transporter [Sulfobacillus thermosulfidooxidans]|uniref:EamA family transporter n=1 Tax=Sulfobacillus thermosulfidooxidans TaxID=28034 RepID=UPI0006B68F06|nr:DMT family transporter [Sulfobacillus thermosulfidooxidans]